MLNPAEKTVDERCAMLAEDRIIFDAETIIALRTQQYTTLAIEHPDWTPDDFRAWQMADLNERRDPVAGDICPKHGIPMVLGAGYYGEPDEADCPECVHEQIAAEHAGELASENAWLRTAEDDPESRDEMDRHDAEGRT